MSIPIRRSPTESSPSHGISRVLHLRFLGAEAILVLLVAILSVMVRQHPGPLSGDVGLELDTQHLLLPHPALTAPLEAISTLNWPIPTAITLAIIVVLFLVLRRWLDAVIIPVAAGVSSLVTFELSRWVHRPRPSGYGIHRLQVITSTYSYPSGHVAYAVAIFGLLLFLTFQIRRYLHVALLWSIRLLLILLIVLMPISRIVEGEHWPSDTLAAAIEGLFWLFLFAHLYLWARTRWPGLRAPDEA